MNYVQNWNTIFVLEVKQDGCTWLRTFYFCLFIIISSRNSMKFNFTLGQNIVLHDVFIFQVLFDSLELGIPISSNLCSVSTTEMVNENRDYVLLYRIFEMYLWRVFITHTN